MVPELVLEAAELKAEVRARQTHSAYRSGLERTARQADIGL